MELAVSLTVNGRRYDRTIEPRLLLVHFLRDTIGGYPYLTSELVQLEVTIPRLAATCASCCYFFLDRASAPRVCPSAMRLTRTVAGVAVGDRAAGPAMQAVSSSRRPMATRAAAARRPGLGHVPE